MKRNLLTGMSALAACLVVGAAHADDINVRVNGDPVRFDGAQPRQMDGRVMVPLRGVLEKMGANVDWLASSQTVVATKGNMELNLPIGSRTATVNGREVHLDVPAMTIAGSTMVPLRFVSEALGADVRWTSSTQTVSIEMDKRNIADNRGARDVTYNGSQNDARDRSERRAYRNARRVTLPVGTVIPFKLDDQLSSNENRVGDKFSATIESGRDDAGLPSGTKVEGVIREAIPSRNGKPGVLDVDFNRIVFPNNMARTLDAGLISLQNKGIERGSDGRLMAKGRNEGNERLKWVGIGAGAGLLLSTVTKGNTLVDTILGAGAGYLFNETQRKGAGNVNLKAGTEMGVKLNTAIAFNPDNFDNSR